MRDFKLDQLQAFADVVALGSFSAAAERRQVTQPAVSLQVRQLEQRLGVRLIERIGRRATPTAAGLDLLEHVVRIEAAVAGARAAMAFHASGAVGRVRIGSGATACIYLLPPLLAELRRRFPSLDVVVSTGNAPEIVRDVEDNRLDLALVTLPASGRSLAVNPLLEDPFVAIFPAAEAPPPGPVGPAFLAERPVVAYAPGANTRRLLDDWFQTAGLPLKPAMELASVEAIKELVAAGLGCSLLPLMAVPESRRPASLAVRPLAPALTRTLGLVLRRDKPLLRGLREVVRALEGLAG